VRVKSALGTTSTCLGMARRVSVGRCPKARNYSTFSKLIEPEGHAVSPTNSEHDAEPGIKHETNNYYDPNITSNGANDGRIEYDELHVVCPPHTTEKKLMAKIDLRVIPFLCILYLLAFLDRVNIANARSFGLVKDLDLKNVEYNTALTIFFVPYVAFEIPSNVLMKKLKPHIWLSGCMFMFGVVTVCQGLVQNYSGLLATRFFLGFFEVWKPIFGLIGIANSDLLTDRHVPGVLLFNWDVV
jgi:hypothetical protein